MVTPDRKNIGSESNGSKATGQSAPKIIHHVHPYGDDAPTLPSSCMHSRRPSNTLVPPSTVPYTDYKEDKRSSSSKRSIQEIEEQTRKLWHRKSFGVDDNQMPKIKKIQETTPIPEPSLSGSEPEGSTFAHLEGSSLIKDQLAMQAKVIQARKDKINENTQSMLENYLQSALNVARNSTPQDTFFESRSDLMRKQKPLSLNTTSLDFKQQAHKYYKTAIQTPKYSRENSTENTDRCYYSPFPLNDKQLELIRSPSYKGQPDPHNTKEKDKDNSKFLKVLLRSPSDSQIFKRPSFRKIKALNQGDQLGDNNVMMSPRKRESVFMKKASFNLHDSFQIKPPSGPNLASKHSLSSGANTNLHNLQSSTLLVPNPSPKNNGKRNNGYFFGNDKVGKNYENNAKGGENELVGQGSAISSEKISGETNNNNYSSKPGQQMIPETGYYEVKVNKYDYKIVKIISGAKRRETILPERISYRPPLPTARLGSFHGIDLSEFPEDYLKEVENDLNKDHADENYLENLDYNVENCFDLSKSICSNLLIAAEFHNFKKFNFQKFIIAVFNNISTNNMQITKIFDFLDEKGSLEESALMKIPVIMSHILAFDRPERELLQATLEACLREVESKVRGYELTALFKKLGIDILFSNPSVFSEFKKLAGQLSVFVIRRKIKNLALDGKKIVSQLTALKERDEMKKVTMDGTFDSRRHEIKCLSTEVFKHDDEKPKDLLEMMETTRNLYGLTCRIPKGYIKLQETGQEVLDRLRLLFHKRNLKIRPSILIPTVAAMDSRHPLNSAEYLPPTNPIKLS